MKISYPYSTKHLDAKDFGFTLKGDKKSYSNRPSIYVLLFNDEGKVASIKYREEVGRIYPLPGGGVNEREEWEEGLMREVQEEIGCAIKDIKPIGSFDSYDNSTMRCFQSVICRAKLQGEPTNPESVEDYEQGAELIWITTEDLIKRLEELAGPVESVKDDRSRFTLEILKETFKLK
jgi:ADP-ribose pyrophosphatase YjhB (NUDIX family)